MKRPTPVNEEVLFDGRSLISETDTKGIITYVNRKFTEMTGYTALEAVGQPHSLLRHPDMPKVGFEQMWKVIESGKIWEGYVKNLRKDGQFYWVVVHIVPKLNEAGEIMRQAGDEQQQGKRADPRSIRRQRLHAGGL